MNYLTVKALHIIAVISWMAALLYLVRLFIYHTEARDRSKAEWEILHAQFTLMERRLWRGIAIPAMLVALTCGITMLVQVPELLSAPWMHIKLTLVILLLLYHFSCGILRTTFVKSEHTTPLPFWTSSKFLRFYNEVSTFLMAAIVFAVTLKNVHQTVQSMLWIAGVITLIFLAIRVLKTLPKKSS